MKIAFQGHTGKMGSVVYQYLIDEKYEIIELFDRNKPFEGTIDEQVDVIIDFSILDASRKIIDFGIQHQIPVISGTTGFTKQELVKYDIAAKKARVGIYIVANFLPSISSLYNFLRSAAKNYDKIYIDETHHASKVDAPSGTALFLAKAIPLGKITKIEAKRIHAFIYEHDIILANQYERVKINHQVLDKKGYAVGVSKSLKTIKTFIGLKQHI